MSTISEEPDRSVRSPGDHMAQQLTLDQIERIEAVATAMGQRGNVLCRSLSKSLAGKTPEQKRAFAVSVYVAAYELMLAFQMAMDSTRSVEDIKKSLAESGATK
jgi:hypothetical protein